MTNAEYNEFAKKVLEEVDKIKFENEKTITHVSELFYLKIREAVIHWRNKKDPYFTAKECEIIFNNIDESNDTSEELSTIYNNSNLRYTQLGRFRMYQLLIENFPNIENILSELGIKDFKDFILKVKNMNEIKSEEDWEIVSTVVYCFEEKNNKQTNFFSKLASYYWVKNLLLFFLNDFDKDFFLSCSKRAKYIGENYPDICKERLKFYNDIFSDNYSDNRIEVFIRFTAKNILQKKKNFYKSNLNEEKLEDINISPAFFLDFIFVFYFLLYSLPFLVILSFQLLSSEKAPLYLKDALRKSLKEPDFAPIIQFEYNWFLEKPESDNLFTDIFYSGELINLNSFGIVDYDLYNWESPFYTAEENNSVKESPQIGTNNQFIQEYDILSRISYELYPYYTLFDESASTEKGHIFRKIYLPSLIIYANNIQDNYSLYGFAYLLYKSQYLNWKGLKFDEKFVRGIASVFAIDFNPKQSYIESKAKLKAWEILENSSIPLGILDEKEIKQIKPIKSKK